MTNCQYKMLHLSCVWGPTSALEIPPDMTQTERTQFTQKTLSKKAGEKYIVCLYFSRDVHPMSPTFIKLIFKTVNESCVDDIKRRAVPAFYDTAIKNFWCIVDLKGGFFNLKLCSLVIEFLSNANECSNNGSYPFNTL